FSSELVQYKSKYKVFINKESNCSRQWQDFGHEMYHYFIDHVEYDLLSRSYAYYSETKADYFAYHFCVPTFMLRKFNNLDVYDVMYYFNVEFDFALKRIEMYKNSLCYMK